MTAIAAILTVPVTFVLAVVGHGLWRDQPTDRVRAMRPTVSVWRAEAGRGWSWDVHWRGEDRFDLGSGVAGGARTWLGARFAAWRVAR